MENSIQVWKKAERWMGGPFKFCQNMPLWHNPGLLCGSKPFIQPSWSSLGVNTLGDIYDAQGLCCIRDLRTRFSLAASSYFVYFQLRSALKAYGVPWNSPLRSHPMWQWIAPLLGRSSVSIINSLSTAQRPCQLNPYGTGILGVWILTQVIIIILTQF